MKKEFSKHWIASKKPRKQRKYVANAPLHLKRKTLSANLSKELRKSHGRRNLELRKGDTVKILRGKFKKKQGKILEVKTKTQTITVDGIQRKKMDGSKINVPMKASNLQIVELNMEDKKRIKKGGKSKDIKEDSSKENKEEKK